MKKIVIIGGLFETPSHYMLLDLDKEAATSGDKLMLASDKKRKNGMIEGFHQTIQALMTLPVEIINLADGGGKGYEGWLGNQIDSAWSSFQNNSEYRATYTHPNLSTEDRSDAIRRYQPDFVINFGGAKQEQYDFTICRELRIPTISPKAWSNVGDEIFNEVSQNMTHYFGQQAENVQENLSLCAYLYKGVYAPYLGSQVIKSVVVTSLSLQFQQKKQEAL